MYRLNNIYIYGDSHAGRMANIAFDVVQSRYGINNEYSTCSSNYYDRVVDHLDSGGNKVFHGMSSSVFDMSYGEKTLTIASTPGRSALNLDYDFYRYTKDWDSSNSLIMPWFGYIDIKNWLPQKNLKNYKTAKEVVDIYVDKTLNKFKNSKVVFINPMPQFEVIISARWANFASDPAIDFEDRHSMHLEFSQILIDKCKEVGINSPINISEILNTEWINTSMQFKKPIKELYNDHLRPDYYMSILTSILDMHG